MASEPNVAASTGALPRLVALSIVSVQKQIIHTRRINAPGKLCEVLSGRNCDLGPVSIRRIGAVLMITDIRRATTSGHTEKISVIGSASESMIVVRVRELAGSSWVVDIGVDGHAYDIVVGHRCRHAILAPGVGSIPWHLAVHRPVVGLLLFDVLPDFAGVVRDPEIARPLRIGRIMSDSTVREDYVFVSVVFRVCEGGE